jgi:2Fe-2S ferredoxin
MKTPEKNIALSVRLEEREHAFSTYPNEYRNLMELLNDKLYLEDFGDCRGVGRCGTCAVHVLPGAVPAGEPERNEKTTLTRSGLDQPGSRLSCQMVIDACTNGLRVEVIRRREE